ncbi:MAG: AAA family ATPase, partial [Actinobacteria bacterium]|nr:AAA family ATPase [Actinomycetota bacterium]
MATLFSGDELTGEVLGVLYADTATGFGVVELGPEVGAEHGAGARCSGPLSDLVEGQTVRLVGGWKDHPKYGRTFEAVLYEQVTPTTEAGLKAFLLSDRFREIDPDDLERVLDAFGDAAGAAIEAGPDRLVAEAGLDRTVADQLHAAWVAGQSLSELARMAEPAGIPFDVVRAVHARFGADAPDVARADPYALLEVERCRFAHVDALARVLGLRPDDPRRLAAGARAAVTAGRRRDGHQYLTRDQVVTEASRLLKVDAVLAAEGLEAAVAAGTLGRERIRVDGQRTVAISTPGGLRAEEKLARELVRLLEASHPRLLPHAGGVEPSVELTEGQAAAVRGVFTAPVSILTGGPGTGKTRTIQEVVRAAEEADLNIALCAPTGRAAKRVEELVGRPATTIHKLLEARPVPGGGFVFRYGWDEKLPYDLVVCDEVSMCDTSLAGSLVAAVDDDAHLL